MNSSISDMEGLPTSKVASSRMRALGFLLLLTLLLPLSAAGAANDPYPSRPVRLILELP